MDHLSNGESEQINKISDFSPVNKLILGINLGAF